MVKPGMYRTYWRMLPALVAGVLLWAGIAYAAYRVVDGWGK